MPGPEVCQLTCLCERWHIFQESPGVNSGPEVVGAGVAPQISQLLVIIGSRCCGTCIIIAGTSQEPPHGSTRPSRPGRAWPGTSSESHRMAPPVPPHSTPPQRKCLHPTPKKLSRLAALPAPPRPWCRRGAAPRRAVPEVIVHSRPFGARLLRKRARVARPPAHPPAVLAAAPASPGHSCVQAMDRSLTASTTHLRSVARGMRYFTRRRLDGRAGGRPGCGRERARTRAVPRRPLRAREAHCRTGCSLFWVVDLPKGGRHRTWLEARKKVYTYIYNY